MERLQRHRNPRLIRIVDLRSSVLVYVMSMEILHRYVNLGSTVQVRFVLIVTY